jgi:hypothetical protein
MFIHDQYKPIKHGLGIIAIMAEGGSGRGNVIPLFRDGQPNVRTSRRHAALRRRWMHEPPGKGIKNYGAEGSLSHIPVKKSDGKAFRGIDVMAEKGSDMVGSEKCIELLSPIAPLSQDLINMLDMPEGLKVLSEDPPIFSSDSQHSAGGIANFFHYGMMWPMAMSDYSLAVSGKGSSVFCTFVDRKRKVIVHTTVNSIYADQGSWAEFERLLKDTLDVAKENTAQGKDFDFVVNNDGVISFR